jgi:hypothetical protein
MGRASKFDETSSPTAFGSAFAGKFWKQVSVGAQHDCFEAQLAKKIAAMKSAAA